MKASLFLRTITAVGCLSCLPFATSAGTPRDGSHDFDFAKGVWHTHITRVLNPLDGGTQTITMEGTKTSRAVWGGRAWVEEIEADGPNGHWEGATFFLYNPKSGEWSQEYIDSATGEYGAPTVGRFSGGKAELFSTQVYQGHTVLVRGVWSDIKADSHRYEISYSQDGGRTWATAFKAFLTRLKS